MVKRKCNICLDMQLVCGAATNLPLELCNFMGKSCNGREIHPPMPV